MRFHMNERGCGPDGRHGGGRGPRGGFDFGGFSMEFGRPDGGREGGRSRRMFDGGELRLVLLKLIADEPRHGYDAIRAIEEMTGGAYAPSPGVVYPTLTLLDEMGLIEEQRSEGSKKRFAATDEGRRHLEENAEQVAALIERLSRLGGRREEWAGSPVWRAVRNLGVAIRQRVGRGDLSQDTLHDVAAMIDEVAQKIERLR